MNFKTMLLTTAAVTMIAGVANAKDFTGSLFLPSQGELLSNTSIEHGRLKDKYFGVDKTLQASEELTYGITDNLSVYGSITNNFDGKYAKPFPRIVGLSYNNDHNFSYELGVKYNHNFGKVLTQAGLGYSTYQTTTWYGHHTGRRSPITSDWQKAVNAEVQVGYDMGNGWTPYARFDVSSAVDTKNRVMNYSAFAGVHKTFDKVAIDTGLRYDFNTDGDITYRGLTLPTQMLRDGSNNNTEQYFWQLEADYFLTDNVALGIHGDYFLGGDDKFFKTKYNYTVGAQLKVLF